MRECKRCFELVVMIHHYMMDNQLEEAKKATKELMALLDGYDNAC